MTLPAWHEEPVSRKHDRNAFDCGDAAMNDFLQRYARQSHDLGGAPDLAHAPCSNGVLRVHAESARGPLGYESYHPAARGTGPTGPTSDRKWTLPLGPPMTDPRPTLRKGGFTL